MLPLEAVYSSPGGPTLWRNNYPSYENRGLVPIRFLCVVPLTDAYETEWLAPAVE